MICCYPGDLVIRGGANHVPVRLYRTVLMSSGDWVGTMEKDDVGLVLAIRRDEMGNRALVLNTRQQLGWVEELRLDPA